MARQTERGAVSLFVVIFTALLVTIVTASYVQLMLKAQSQAANNDLSQSAYDSAMSGVEDAKRALVKLRECQAQGAAQASCVSSIVAGFADQSCFGGLTAAGVIPATVNDEVVVGDEALNQAYTCVKVALKTDTVSGKLEDDNDSKVVELAGVSDFNTVRVSWFQKNDVPKLNRNGSNVTDTRPNLSSVQALTLPPIANWPVTRPPVLRTQLMQFANGSINTNDFDSERGPAAKTLFLWPSQAGGTTGDFSVDSRRENQNLPLLTNIKCDSDYVKEYLCQATIRLPAPDTAANQTYLQLASIYNPATYSIELFNDATPVLFDNVQPVVDSTGRASDLFRRVKARVSINGGSVTFPSAALSLSGDLCKDFFITNTITDYKSDASGDGQCTP